MPGYVYVVITPGGPDDISTVTCVGDENSKPYSLLEIAINRLLSTGSTAAAIQKVSLRH